jgi:SHS2 domain-containing protein
MESGMTSRNSRGWRVIDHTADIGLAVDARSLERLFERAAEALFAQITDRTPVPADRSQQITAAGIDWPDLMFNWLRELFYLWAGEQRIVTGARVRHLAPYVLRAEVQSAGFDPSVHRIVEEIKAVTYHQLRVERIESGWSARFFLDV